jgi:hypothetical protein
MRYGSYNSDIIVPLIWSKVRLKYSYTVFGCIEFECGTELN